MRLVSHTEASTLLDCMAKHAFRYSGTLTGGDALEPPPAWDRRAEGKVWGRAVATLHETGDLRAASVALVHEAHTVADEVGCDPSDPISKLDAILRDYAAGSERIPLVEPERELVAPIPGVDGYALQGFLDGVHWDEDGRPWLVEFKLRRSLTPLPVIELDRQCRWYAWAWRATTGQAPAGAIIDERLNAVPDPVKFNAPDKSGRVVPSKTQSCSPSAYRAACHDAGIEPHGPTLARLNRKRWQQRHRVVFQPFELDEVDAQLRTVAKLVAMFDAGELFPVRNPNQNRCLGCDFKDICPDPTDVDIIDALYARVPAKRNRPTEVTN